MISDIKRLLNGFVPAALICTIPAFLIWLDTAIFDFGCHELGIVEITQTLVLLMAVVLTNILVKVAKPLRGGLVLVGGFFFAMLIREQDAIFDLIFHGFWLIPALVITFIALYIAYRHKETIMPGLMHIRNNHHFPALTLGLFLLLGFSRVFGTKAIWRTICDNDYAPAKHAAEEGTELVAYAIIMYWAICYFLDVIKEYKGK